jgi:hypothetical protein
MSETLKLKLPCSVLTFTTELSLTPASKRMTPLSAMLAFPPLPFPTFLALLPRRTVRARVVAFQPVVSWTSSPSSKRQPSMRSILPGETERVPSHFVGDLSVRPNRMRTPTSMAKTGSEDSITNEPQRILSIVDFADGIKVREDTEEEM